MNFKTKFKKNKGITLIALVVTIIVLLILAGISITMLTGQNGILNRTGEAKERNGAAQTDENVKLAVADALTKGTGSIIKENLEEALNKYLGEGNCDLAEDTDGWQITVDGKKYNVSSSGGVSEENKKDDEDDKEDSDSWKSLNVTDKMDRLKNMTARLAIFDKSVAGTKSDYNSESEDDDRNKTDKQTTMDKAECKCGKVREIFDKAVEMGLVKDYTELETQTITSDDGTERNREIITAPIEEESVVLFDFYSYNFEQKTVELIPMAFSAEYYMNPNGKEWLNGFKPTFHKGSIEHPEEDKGDNETILTWVNEEYAKNGFVGMEARAAAYPKKTVTEVGQVVHRKISVLTKTDFVKAMKALGLDLSEYEGQCAHPVK